MTRRLLFTVAFTLILVASLITAGQLAAAKTQAAFETLWINPQEIDFGPVGVGQSAPTIVVTIVNKGSVPLTNFAGGGLGSPYNVSQDCVIPGGVLPDHACHYFFDFKPVASGAFTATSSSTTNLGPIQVTVHGQGVDGIPVADETSLDFGSVITGGHAQQIVTIRNVGLAPLTQFAGGGLSAPFNVSQDCVIPGGILPGKSCHYFFDFSPTSVGDTSATSSSTIQGKNININVKGSGRTTILANGQYVTPLAFDFGPVGIGNSSPVFTSTIINQDTLQGITGFAGGGVSAPFNASQDCAGGVPAGGNCHYFFTFAPNVPGSFSATSSSTDSFGPFSIQLKGTGVAPQQTVNPLAIDFGPQFLNITSTIVVTITNTGLSAISNFAGGGVGTPFNITQDCVIPGGLKPGKSCHYFVTFHPTQSGIYDTTSMSITNAGNFNIKIHGEGTHPALFLPIIMR